MEILFPNIFSKLSGFGGGIVRLEQRGSEVFARLVGDILDDIVEVVDICSSFVSWRHAKLTSPNYAPSLESGELSS